MIFVADHERRFDLWRSQVGTGVFVNLGQNMPPQRPPGILHRAFGFTADGSESVLGTGDALGRKLLMPMTGGAPRPFLNPRQTAPAWSPDGQQLAYMTIPTELESGDPLSVADGSGANPRTIIFPEPKVHIHNPTWSPDGQWIYFVRGTDPTGSMDVWRIRPSGGASEQLTYQRAAVNFLAPLDARTVLYVARAADWSGPCWSLDVQTKTTRRVSVGLPQYISVAASRDGRRVVATVAHPTASLWKVPLLDGAAGEADVQPYPLPVPTDRALGPRFRGTSLFYLSGSGAGDGLWKLQGGQASEVRRDLGGALTEPAAISHDGSRVALVVREGGNGTCPSCPLTERTPGLSCPQSTSPAPLVRALPIGRRTTNGLPRANGCARPRAVQDSREGWRASHPRLRPGLQPGLVTGRPIDLYGDGLGAEVNLRAVRPDGTRVDSSPLQGRAPAPVASCLTARASCASRLRLSQNRASPIRKYEEVAAAGKPRRPRSVDELRHHARWQVHRLRLFARELEHRAVRAAGEVTPGKSA